MQPVMKTVLIGKDSVYTSILIDDLNIVELSIQGTGPFVMPNAYPMHADVIIQICIISLFYLDPFAVID